MDDARRRLDELLRRLGVEGRWDGDVLYLVAPTSGRIRLARDNTVDMSLGFPPLKPAQRMEWERLVRAALAELFLVSDPGKSAPLRR